MLSTLLVSFCAIVYLHVSEKVSLGPYDSKTPYLDGKYYIGKTKTESHLLDADGNILWKADAIYQGDNFKFFRFWSGSFGDKVALFYAGDDFGYGKFVTGKYDEIINPSKPYGDEMYFEKFLVREGDNWGVVSYQGETIVPVKYSEVWILSSRIHLYQGSTDYNFLAVSPEEGYLLYTYDGSNCYRVGGEWYHAARSAVRRPLGKNYPVSVVTDDYIKY